METGDVRKISVFTADDHDLLRAGIAGMIAGEADMVLVGEAVTGADAVRGFREFIPDVMLMDLQMPDMHGARPIELIRAEFPFAKIVVLTTYPGDVNARNALLAGAMGYLLKSALREGLITAIRAVHAGQHCISSEVAQELAEHIAERSKII
ncbi:response regulator [Dyella silvatica]|uniref:response regulator n=1 Tax=Dyella silvatica TaxID=2992128 RepID=UPI002253C3FC|nr:response regulator transcription factor [Dyella silvatica]